MNRFKGFSLFCCLVLLNCGFAQVNVEIRRATVQKQAQDDWQMEFDSIYNVRKERLPIDSTCFYDGRIEALAYCHKRIGTYREVDSLGKFYTGYGYIDSISYCARTDHLFSIEIESFRPLFSTLEKDSILRREFREKIGSKCLVDTGEWMAFLPWETGTSTIYFDRAIPFNYQRYLATIERIRAEAKDQDLECGVDLFTFPNGPWCLIEEPEEASLEFLLANRYIVLEFQLGNKGSPKANYNVLFIN